MGSMVLGRLGTATVKVFSAAIAGVARRAARRAAARIEDKTLMTHLPFVSALNPYLRGPLRAGLSWLPE
jgi:hypothetical protein